MPRSFLPVRTILQKGRRMIHRPTLSEVLRCAPPAGVSVKMQGPDVKPFDPSTLPGLTLWLKAAVGTTVDGGGHVLTWADQSGLHHDFSLVGGDVGATIGVDANGNTALLFSEAPAIPCRYIITGLPRTWDQLVTQNAWCVAWVCEYTGTHTADPAFGNRLPVVIGTKDSPPNYQSFGAGLDPADATKARMMGYEFTGATDQTVNGPDAPVPGVHCAVLNYTGGILSLSVDGGAFINQAAAAGNAPAGFTVQLSSNDQTSFSQYGGYVEEILTMDQAQSAGNLAGLSAYLKTKYGIP